MPTAHLPPSTGVKRRFRGLGFRVKGLRVQGEGFIQGFRVKSLGV